MDLLTAAGAAGDRNDWSGAAFAQQQHQNQQSSKRGPPGMHAVNMPVRFRHKACMVLMFCTSWM